MKEIRSEKLRNGSGGLKDLFLIILSIVIIIFLLADDGRSERLGFFKISKDDVDFGQEGDQRRVECIDDVLRRDVAGEDLVLLRVRASVAEAAVGRAAAVEAERGVQEEGAAGDDGETSRVLDVALGAESGALLQRGLRCHEKRGLRIRLLVEDFEVLPRADRDEHRALAVGRDENEADAGGARLFRERIVVGERDETRGVDAFAGEAVLHETAVGVVANDGENGGERKLAVLL